MLLRRDFETWENYLRSHAVVGLPIIYLVIGAFLWSSLLLLRRIWFNVTSKNDGYTSKNDRYKVNKQADI